MLFVTVETYPVPVVFFPFWCKKIFLCTAKYRYVENADINARLCNPFFVDHRIVLIRYLYVDFIHNFTTININRMIQYPVRSDSETEMQAFFFVI